MVTVAAERSLKVLKSNLTLSAKGVKNIEMAVKSYRQSIIDAANADCQFGGSKEYTQLEKQFSTFYLPKATEMATYAAKALAILDKVIPTKAPITAEDIEEWASGNDCY